MKPTHIDMIIAWFKARGGVATRREIAESGQPWAWEFTARASNLRHRTKYDLVCVEGKTASQNTYTLQEKPLVQPDLLRREAA